MDPFSKSALAALAALALLAKAPAARADVIYDAIGTDTSGQAFTTIQVTGPVAESFSTGRRTFVFTDLKLLLGVATPPDHKTISVDLLSDNANAPGTVISHLATIQDSKLSSWAEPSIYNVHVPSIDLAPQTRYWIQLSSPKGSTAVWAYTQDMSGKGVGGEYDAYSVAQLVCPNPESGTGAYQMAVQGDPPPIPEPTSLALLGVAVAGIGTVARRRPRAR